MLLELYTQVTEFFLKEVVVFVSTTACSMDEMRRFIYQFVMFDEVNEVLDFRGGEAFQVNHFTIF